MLRGKNGNINIRVNHIAQRPLEKGPVVAEPEEFQPFDLQAEKLRTKQTEPVVESTGGIRATHRLTSFDYGLKS